MLDVLLLTQSPVVTVEVLYVYLSNFTLTSLYICGGFEVYATTAWPCLLLSYLLLFCSNCLCLWLTSPVAFQVLLSHRQAIFQSHGPAGFLSSHNYLAQMC